jgi:ribosomal protein S8
MVNITEFIAGFNHAVLTKQRTFTVSRTSLNFAFAAYLKKSGYILGFHCPLGGRIAVYPNHLLSLSGIFAVSVPSRPVFYSLRRLQTDLTAGKKYILYVDGFFCDSYSCLLTNKSGMVLAKFFKL